MTVVQDDAAAAAVEREPVCHDLHGVGGASRAGGFQERRDVLLPLGESAEEAPE